MDFDDLAQYIYGTRDYYEIDVEMRTKNGDVGFGIATFLLNYCETEFSVAAEQSSHSYRLQHWSISAPSRPRIQRSI
jgi:hypothetical protein